MYLYLAHTQMNYIFASDNLKQSFLPYLLVPFLTKGKNRSTRPRWSIFFVLNLSFYLSHIICDFSFA